MILDFFTLGPIARLKGLLVGLAVLAAIAAALTGWALLERSWRFQAEKEVETVKGHLVRERDQVKVLGSAIEACSAGVDLAKRVADAAIAGTGELVAQARRLKAGVVHTREVIERTLEQPATPAQAAACDWGWDEIEAEYRRRKAGAP